jgi:hypothetical protein
MQFVDIPIERTTAATDALLALVALWGMVYVIRLARYAASAAGRWRALIWASAFGLLSLASALGAVAHGFQMAQATNDLLLQPLNLALGLTIALFCAGVIYDAWGATAARRALAALIAAGVVFFAVTRLLPGTFLVFILYEAAAMLFALAVYLWLAVRRAVPWARWMLAGILVTIVAAAVQATRAVSLTVVWPFDYNGVFHLIQLVGVVVLVLGLRQACLIDQGPVAAGAG